MGIHAPLKNEVQSITGRFRELLRKNKARYMLLKVRSSVVEVL